MGNNLLARALQRLFFISAKKTPPLFMAVFLFERMLATRFS